MDTERFENIIEQRNEAKKQIAEAIKPDVNDEGWKDYQIADGKVVRGGYQMKTGEWVVARHHLKLTKDQLAQLGMLQIDTGARNGAVYVNGQEVGRLPGWQAIANVKFQHDVSQFLKPGDNVVAIAIHHYRRKGQLPSSVVLDPKEDCQNYHRSLNLRDALADVRYKRDGMVPGSDRLSCKRRPCATPCVCSSSHPAVFGLRGDRPDHPGMGIRNSWLVEAFVRVARRSLFDVAGLARDLMRRTTQPSSHSASATRQAARGTRHL